MQGTQQTLTEMLDRRTERADVEARRRSEAIAGWQLAKPPEAGRRCNCRHERGGACHFSLNADFERTLKERAPSAHATFVKAGPEALRSAVQVVLGLPVTDLVHQKPYPRGTIWDWRVLDGARP